MPPWRRRGRRSTGRGAQMSARERGRLVRKLGERLMERADEVARLETLHNGKPISESRHIEIPAAAECFEYYGGWSDKVMGETIPVKGNHLTYTLREPIGVVAAIVPWNFPLLLAAWKVAPALACGNTVILKPASQTPLTALALGEIAIEVGLAARRAQRPDRARRDSSGRRIVEHPGIDKIAFTGDTSTGKGIMRGAAEHAQEDHARARRQVAEHRARRRRSSMRRSAARPIGIFYGKGEVCAAGSRLLVDRSIKDEFIDKLAARAKKDDAGRSDGSEDPLRRALVEEAARHRAALHRLRQAGRGDARGRRRAHRHRDRQGLLRAADSVRRCRSRT